MIALGALFELSAGGGAAPLVVAFLGGLISSLNPCVMGSLFLLIGFMANSGSAGGKRRLWVWAVAFALGTLAAFTLVGLVAAQAGTWLGLISRRWYVLMAAITAWMGLQTLHVLPGPAWATPGPSSSRRGAWAALLLGGVAGVILSPCATPVLVAVLNLAVTAGRGRAVGLLFAYGLGRAVPLVLIGVSSDVAQGLLTRPGTRRFAEGGRVVLGVGILALAGYFLYLGV
ncbi:MAG: cytochrome c biogenesis protein CcdA [Bacillota bacterium]|nr:cytochrome c biogenesis protein CcdA [Bacillota bacterium]